MDRTGSKQLELKGRQYWVNHGIALASRIFDVDQRSRNEYRAFMPETDEVARFLRAAVKTGLRLQRSQTSGAGDATVGTLQRIKASVRKSKRRSVIKQGE